jgi:hypothetical protein
MSERNTLVRSLHDVGLAAWFGGSLMGATALNGAASEAASPVERLRLANVGWAKWTPWQIAAVGTHAIGGIGLIIANRKRVAQQPGAGSNTAVKLALTVAAAGVTAYSGVLGAKLKKFESDGAASATEPKADSSPEQKSAQQQLKIAQWAIPALTGVLFVLGAAQGEQQRGISGLLDLGSDEVKRGFKQALKSVA